MIDNLNDKYKYRQYDFSQAEYINSKVPLKCICKHHGVFYKSYSKLVHRSQSCAECSKEIHRFMHTSKSLSLLYEKHNHNIHYGIEDISVYPAVIAVYCPKHGKSTTNLEALTQRKFGCIKCSIEHTADLKRKDLNDFISKAKTIHGDKYDYSKSIYTEAKNKITITCTDHGDFEQLVSGHLSGYGCKKCASNGKGRVDMDKPCKLYYFNVIGTNLYKIGVTAQSLKERYRTKFDKDQMRIIFIKEYRTGREAYEKEQYLLKTYNQHLYNGPKVLGSGNTELFTVDVFNGDYSEILEDT